MLGSKATVEVALEMSETDLARVWLRANGYGDVADLIDEVMEEWRRAGKKTRRNWWDVLAGGKDGRPCVIAGRVFPVLMAAQRRQGKPITENAICRKEEENPPPIRRTGRWPGKPKKKRRTATQR